MVNCCYNEKEVRSRSDRDQEIKLSWAHTVTLIYTDINFWVTDSVANKAYVSLSISSHICLRWRCTMYEVSRVWAGSCRCCSLAILISIFIKAHCYCYYSN